jgi:sulfite exporter TauE/SafE
MLWTAFMLGLAGSLHCAGMCGPLSLALPATGSGSVGFVAGRLAYNFGRITTYAALGVVIGWLGRSLALAGVQRWVSMAAGIAIIAGLVSSHRASGAGLTAAAVRQLKIALGAVLRRRSISSLWTLGLLNGLLPCGLVYAAAAGAVATGGWLLGIGYMALFGLGTLPVMLGISLSGSAMPVSLRLRLQQLVPLSAAAVGVLLILRGMSLGIPYLSPDLSAGGCAHCH